MSELVSGNLMPRTTADFKAAIAQCIQEIDRLQSKIDVDDAEIERLKVETRSMLTRMKAE